MDEPRISPSSSTSLVTFTEEPPATDSLHQKLRLVVETSPDRWAYVIFWQKLSEDQSGQCFLAWGDGHFRGTNNHKPHQNLTNSGMDQCEAVMEGGESVCDLEWFYVMSLTRSFHEGDESPRKDFTGGSLLWLTGDDDLRLHGCDRAKEASLHGVQTFVSVPLHDGIIELGSPDKIPQNWSFVNWVKSLFGSDMPEIPQTQPPPLDSLGRVVSFADIGITAALLQGQKTRTGSGLNPSCPPFVTDSEYSDFDAVFRAGNKRRRKLGSSTAALSTVGSPVNHVEAERQRREKLNHRFYALRAVVPNVSRMDKASLLSDAVSFINELKSKIEELETQLQTQTQTQAQTQTQTQTQSQSSNNTQSNTTSSETGVTISGAEVQVKMAGDEAVVRVQSENVNHPTAALMGALREMECRVIHVSASRVNDLMVQDAVVWVPLSLRSDDSLQTELVRKLNPNQQINE